MAIDFLVGYNPPFSDTHKNTEYCWLNICLAQTSSLVVKNISITPTLDIFGNIIYPIRYTHSAHSCHIKAALFFLVKLILSPFWMAHSLEFSILDDYILFDSVYHNSSWSIPIRIPNFPGDISFFPTCRWLKSFQIPIFYVFSW